VRPTRETVVVAAWALALACAGAGCSHDAKDSGGKGGGGGRGPVTFPVEVVPVSSRAVEYAVHAVGSVEAFEIVQVTRAFGAVEKILFREGDRVHEGDVLVEIEPDRYRLAVEEAQATLEKARAALAEAEAGLARREGANEKTPGLIPGEEIDAWRTRVATAKAEVASTGAALQLDDKNARDAVAKAPFAGTVQTRNVQTGEYVQPGALLTTLVRRDPLLVRFQVPEEDAARLQRGMTARFRVRDSQQDREARIVLVAGAADAASRMVAVTAEVAHPDEKLRPGTFAEINVPIGARKDAPVIPQTAVRPSERGFLAYVVQGDVAHERVLTLGLRTGDGLVEVREGLAPSESLVVRGAEALQDGAKVKVVTASGGAPGGANAPATAGSAGR
jgi:multidrug efflux system membrane fusion protein